MQKVLYVKMPGDQQINHVCIHSVSGKKVHDQELRGTEATLELSALPTGVYILTVRTEKQALKKRLVIE